MSYVLSENQLDSIEHVLQQDIINLGVAFVVLIDMAGNVIASGGNGTRKHDIYALAALAAGNFGAVSAMAKLLGEEEFSLLFHKGKRENIHFSRVSSEFLMVTIFGNEVSLGFLRLKVTEAIDKLKEILAVQNQEGVASAVAN